MKKIGIIAALEKEVTTLIPAIENMEKIEKTAGTFYHGTIGGYEIILMQCGMGKVSAGAGTQALISLFEPDCIINTGCAGGLAKGLNIGDIVISTETVQWDLDTEALGDPRGYIQSLDTIRIPADKQLADAFIKAIPADKKVFKGLVVSGDQFVDKKEQTDIIFASFPDALCAEMEGAAIGQVCAINKVPFCIVRTMSDTADNDSKIDYPVFARKAGEQSAAVLIDFLKM